jgi:ParB family chromosome partitioning protein
MAPRRNALGKGLGALISEPPPSVGTEPAEASGRPFEIDVDRIVPNPQQPRRHFDDDKLAGLASSIRTQGVIEPIVVRRVGEEYELIVGERRWRASLAAGLRTIPALVKELAPRHSLELALVENVQRQDLNPIELAHAFKTLAEGGLTQDSIGERVSLDRSTVSNHLRLLELPREMQEDVERGRITMGHAKALLQVSHPERRRHLRDRIVQRGLSVRETEELARTVAGPSRGQRARVEPDATVAPIADALRDRLKTRVRIRGRAARGRIEIEYHGAEDLDRIARLLLGG